MPGLLQQGRIHSGTFCANLPEEEVEHPVSFFFFLLHHVAISGFLWITHGRHHPHSSSRSTTEKKTKRKKPRLSNFRRRAHHGRILFGISICQRMSDRGHTVSRSSHMCLCSTFTAPLIKLFYSIFSRVCRCHQLKTKSTTAGCVKTALFWT